MPAGRPSSSRMGRSGSGRPVLSARAGAALGVLVVLIAILALPFKEWITQRARIADLEGQLAWHTQRVDDLEASLDRWKDPAYVETQARSRLHFVRPGQVGYVVLTDTASEESDKTATRPMAEVPQGGPWWSAMWSTVQRAAEPAGSGNAPAAPAPAQPAQNYGQ